jgi:hypothetical protein
MPKPLQMLIIFAVVGGVAVVTYKFVAPKV